MLQRIQLICAAIFIIHIQLSLCDTAQKNSTNSNVSCNPPTISLYYLDQNGSSIIRPMKTRILKFDGKQEVRFLMKCRHHTPIHWIVDEDRIKRDLKQPGVFNESGDASITSRTFGNFSNPSTYIYTAKYYMQLIKRKEHVFFCESFQSSNKNSTRFCTRSVVYGQFNKTSRNYYIQSVTHENIQQEGKKLLDSFERKLIKLKTTTIANKLKNPCPLTLTIGLEQDNSFLVTGWEPPSGLRDNYIVDNAQSLENADLFYTPLSQNCIKVLENDDEIKRCGYCEKVDPDQHDFKPFVLTYMLGKERRILKGFFDLEQERSFYYIWEEVDPMSLIYIDVFSPNTLESLEEAYKGENVSISCSSSVFLFSVGTQIAWSFANDTNYNFLSVSEKESSMAGGVFMANSNLELKRDYLVEKNISLIEINCISPVWNSSEWIVKRQTLHFKHSSLPIIVAIKWHRLNTNDTDSEEANNKVVDEEIMVEENGLDFTLDCLVKGEPFPTVQWNLLQNNLNVSSNTTYEKDLIIQSLSFRKIELHHSGSYICVAQSSVGKVFKPIHLRVLPSTWSKNFRNTMLVTGGSLTILFILSILGLLLKLKRDRENFIRDTEEAIKKFREGFSAQGDLGFRATGAEYKDFEIPLTRWGIESTLLGSGAFGIVQKGTIYHKDNRQSVVAVKRVSSPKNIKDFEASLMELTIMSYIGKHEHIVSLVAACTDKIGTRTILIGVEYCANGDLLHYLQHRKALFTSVIIDGNILLQKDYSDYLNLIIANFCTLDLYKWAYQIANGMNYLRSKKIIHADLACRNILLTSDNVAKISDFGLSRQLITSDSYTKKTNIPLPWKWMALESLQLNSWVIECSDVWSFGVLLWEIFTLGAEPWPQYHYWTTEFINVLEKGERMERPKYGTKNMYSKIMLECWRNEPQSRITFEAAKNFFEAAIIHLNSPEGKDDEFLNSVC